MYCDRLLGFTSSSSDLKRSRLNLSALREYVNNKKINNETVSWEIYQIARCVALLLISGIMCSDTSNTLVSLVYLRYLSEVTEVVSYSWGTAVLAHLYRQLCDSAGKRDDGVGDVSGLLQLLQIWAWSRISCLRLSISPISPESIGPIVLNYGVILPRTPYGARWTCRNLWTHMTRHNVRIFRDMLDNMKPSEFLWMSYDYGSDLLETQPDHCGREYWRARCPLLNYHIIEWHEVNRCTRQFEQA